MTSRWIALGLLVACTPGGETSLDAGMDAGAADATVMDARVILDARETPVMSECPVVDTPCRSRSPSWTVGLRAGDFAPDASFHALGGYAVLLEHEGSFELLRLVPEQKAAERWRVPTGWRALDVYAPDPIYGRTTVWALACRDTSCALFSGDPDSDTLNELSPALPSGAYRGLMLIPSGADTLPCAYGNGLICLVDGTWQTWIEAAHELRKVALDSGALFAIAESGDYWLARYREGVPGPLELQPAKITGTFTSFSAGHGDLAVTTSAGSTNLHADGGTTQCVAPGLQARWIANGYQQGGALFADGRVLLERSRTWCHEQDLELDAPFVGINRERCAIGYMTSILSASTLWQTNNCVYSIP